MDTVRSHATGLTYLQAGNREAPLLLCLHGFPDTPLTWQHLLPPWANAGYHVVAPWLPGYAPSSLDGPLDFLTVTERVLALADELGPGQAFHLLGHDWGAVIAYAAATFAPNRLRTAIAMSIPHPAVFVRNLVKHPSQLARSSYMLFFQLRGLADRALGARNFALVDQLWERWSPGFEPDPVHMEAVKRCLDQSLPGPLDYYRSMLSPNVRRRLRPILEARVTVPTLYFHGVSDGCCAAGILEGQENYYDAELRTLVLEGAGHFLHLEKPDEVGVAVIDWLHAHPN